MTATCPCCGRSWAGSKPEHCPACHETFGGTVAGDRHRVGDHTPGIPTGPRELGPDGRWTTPAPAPRRCLTPAEMRAAGLRQDERGIWRREGPQGFGSALEAEGT